MEFLKMKSFFDPEMLNLQVVSGKKKVLLLQIIAGTNSNCFQIFSTFPKNKCSKISFTECPMKGQRPLYLVQCQLN
jgi:hypothetical protein